MTAPVMHEIPVAAVMPILKRKVDLTSTSVTFTDNYPSTFKRFGIDRSEMMIVMPALMTSDVLSGTEVLKYIGEESDNEENT